MTEYSAADLTVVEFDDSVRRRPGTYFGAARSDPRLATVVLRTVAGHAFHPAAADHVPEVVVDVTADLAFSVTDDQAETLAGEGPPALGYYGSLIPRVRWSRAAAAALSASGPGAAISGRPEPLD